MPRPDRLASLRALCEAYYRAEDTLAYLVTEIEALTIQREALLAYCASDALIPSGGVARYGAAFGHGSPASPGTGVDHAAREHLHNVEEVRREVRALEDRLRAACYDRGCALSIVAPMRVVLRRLDPIDARIIELRFGHLGGTKRAVYTLARIGEEVGLQSESQLRERLNRLHTSLPRMVQQCQRLPRR